MPGEIPRTQFRLEHSLAMKPELAVDRGPSRDSILMGQVAPNEEANTIFLGKQAEPPFRDVWMDVHGAHVLYVMGKRRSGKSYTLGVLAEGLASNSWVRQGSASQAVLIVDTMNVFLTMPYVATETMPNASPEIRELRRWQIPSERIPLTLFRPRGTTLPEGVSSAEISLRPSDLGAEEWCGLFEADPFSDPLGHLITELHGKVALDGYRDDEQAEDIAPKEVFGISDLLDALTKDHDLQRYHRDTRESLRRRLHAVRRLPLFSEDGLDVRHLLRPGHVSVLMLRDLDQQIRSALVALIVKRVMQLRGLSEQEERMRFVHHARAERLAADRPEESARERQRADESAAKAATGLPRSWLIIDEAHNYVPAVGVTPSRKPLKKYVDEGRNLGLSIVVATQNPAGLDPSLQRNADMLIVHSLSRHDDISTAEGMLNASPPDEVIFDAKNRLGGNRTFERTARNLPVGYAMAATDRSNRLFAVRIRPRVTVSGGVGY